MFFSCMHALYMHACFNMHQLHTGLYLKFYSLRLGRLFICFSAYCDCNFLISAMEVAPVLCVICENPLESGASSSTLTEKGSSSINSASDARRDSIHAMSGDRVHCECRRRYCNPHQIAKDVKQEISEQGPSSSRPVLRSSETEFSFKTDCFFCGRPAKLGRKRKYDVLQVKTIGLKDSVLSVCHERADSWSDTVKARILHVHDLHAADAVYHQTCSVNFRTKKQMPMAQTTADDLKRPKLGRPQDDRRAEAFLHVAGYLEDNDDEQTTINDLIDFMNQKLADTEYEAYSYPHMKMKLQELFGERIVLTEINGKPNVVTFRTTARAVLQDYYSKQQQESNTTDEKIKLVQAAAKLIKEDIKAIETFHDMYPFCNNLKSEEASIKYLPDTLRVLLEGLFAGKKAGVKVASIGQAMMQATRPRVLLAPLQFGLGVQLYHHFASRFLIDSLHHHGFCCSYQEVQRFEQNAAQSHGTDIPDLTTEFVQYAADNVDHNLRTLDGHGTFHGMGMMAAITPGISSERPVPRAKATALDIAVVGRVQIRYHKEESCNMSTVTYQKLVNLKAQNSCENLDVLWKASILFGSPRPAWSGMMQFVHHGSHPGKAAVMFMPMIDMNPSDSTCIYSTLSFVSEHARRHGVTPIITFDQPLWWKALMIVESEPEGSDMKGIVLRLGGFHTEMSFLGSIGHLMASSGLQEVLETIYASNAVVHMLSGKAISRAVRAHFIVDAALNALMLNGVYNAPLPCQQIPESDGSNDHNPDITEVGTRPPNEQCADVGDSQDLDEACALYEQLMAKDVSAEDVCTSHVLERIKNSLQKHSEAVKMSSRTAVLWVQYMNMVDVLRKHITAERTGNWALHLQAIQDMLPYMAASGHNLYTKSATVYLHKMSDLKSHHPDVQRHFDEGLHVIRRSDRVWAGLSSDLVIEQVLMRSLKTSGGLTRGRGMTEHQRLLWLLSRPACAQVNQAMQELTGVNYNTGEQNQDMTKARQARDWKDTLTVLQYLQERNPFTSDPSLRSIATGVHAHSTANVDKAVEVGNMILTSMHGKTAVEYTFQRKNQAITLGQSFSIKIDGDRIQIDPQLLFQRLTTVVQSSSELESAFRYELCSYPSALFDSSLLLREADKPALADAIWKSCECDVPVVIPSSGVQYVLDGGALLQRIPWSRGSTYRDICHQYTEYVGRKYGNAIVVFDGYESTNTKDMTHQRRSKGKASTTVTFTADMTCTIKKEQFLANKKNKQRFIFMLSAALQDKNCETYHASGDADLLIVQKAVQSSATSTTVLVGDDTDLIVLLCYHASLDSHDLFFRPEPKKKTKKPRTWDIKATKERLGPEICSHILFMHAFLGCDTTSHLYGIGKGTSLKKFKASSAFCEQAKVFDTLSASMDDVIASGEKALVMVYNGKATESLDSLRHQRFCEKVASKKSHVKPQALPPTSAAAKYHSLRVYLQIQEWKGSAGDLHPTDWGWQECDEGLTPLQTSLPPAPEHLLRVIRCNCQTDCSTLRCSCKKHNIECTLACGNCKGSGCTNISHDHDDDD